MFINDEEKEGRKAALQKLMSVMGSAGADKMRGMKDPNKKMTEDFESPDEGRDEADGFEGGKMPGMDDDDGDEPSSDEKMKIAELYHKYCK